MTITLRGGHTTEDRRLDRIPQYDPKNADYPIRTLIAQAAPRSYTWSFNRNPDPRLDQGSEGACVGFGCGYELALTPTAVTGVTNRFCRERIYWQAQKIDPWDGGSYPGATPTYEGTSVLAGMKVLQSLGAITEYRWCANLDDLVRAIGHTGPVVMGLMWYEGMVNTDERGYIRPTGQVLGGHCIVARGVNIKGRYIRMRNSWGPDWGFNGGDCFITFDDMATLLNNDGEAAVPMGRKLIVL